MIINRGYGNECIHFLQGIKDGDGKMWCQICTKWVECTIVDSWEQVDKHEIKCDMCKEVFGSFNKVYGDDLGYFYHCSPCMKKWSEEHADEDGGPMYEYNLPGNH